MQESRRIFQRMTHYAIYRIAETIRVLLFMTLSILVFNFYPVTAVMIVLLALLNDGAILSIAYDNVHYAKRPDRWNMPVVLGVATSLGLAGVVASFGLFYVAERYFHLDRSMIQSLIYLKLSVAGHLTVFVARTRGPFWSVKPAPILFWAVVVTQLVATLISVYGIFMPPIGWKWAGLVWSYALAWMLVNDRVKLLAYRLFDPNAEPLLPFARNLAALNRTRGKLALGADRDFGGAPTHGRLMPESSGHDSDTSDKSHWRSGFFAFCPRVFFWPARKSWPAQRLRSLSAGETRFEATIGARIVRCNRRIAPEVAGDSRPGADKTRR